MDIKDQIQFLSLIQRLSKKFQISLNKIILKKLISHLMKLTYNKLNKKKKHLLLLTKEAT